MVSGRGAGGAALWRRVAVGACLALPHPVGPRFGAGAAGAVDFSGGRRCRGSPRGRHSRRVATRSAFGARGSGCVGSGGRHQRQRDHRCTRRHGAGIGEHHVAPLHLRDAAGAQLHRDDRLVDRRGAGDAQRRGSPAAAHPHRRRQRPLVADHHLGLQALGHRLVALEPKRHDEVQRLAQYHGGGSVAQAERLRGRTHPDGQARCQAGPQPHGMVRSDQVRHAPLRIGRSSRTIPDDGAWRTPFRQPSVVVARQRAGMHAGRRRWHIRCRIPAGDGPASAADPATPAHRPSPW
jgi:hypothetical protein